MFGLLKRQKKCFFCGQTGEPLETSRAYYVEHSKIYCYHISCLRKSLQTRDGRESIAIRIVRGIELDREEEARDKKKIAEALEYLNKIGGT